MHFPAIYWEYQKSRNQLTTAISPVWAALPSYAYGPVQWRLSKRKKEIESLIPMFKSNGLTRLALGKPRLKQMTPQGVSGQGLKELLFPVAYCQVSTGSLNSCCKSTSHHISAAITSVLLLPFSTFYSSRLGHGMGRSVNASRADRQLCTCSHDHGPFSVTRT